MTEKDLADLLKYSNSKELFIVTYNNLLKLLFCPFRVSVMHHVGSLEKGQKVWVDEVKVTSDLKTVYIIKGKAYFHYHFDILYP